MKRLTPAISALLVLAAGGMIPGQAAAQPANADTVNALILEAEAARSKAASVGYEWRDTEKFIKDARSLMKEGKYDKALALAQKAKNQGELGYRQWQAENGQAKN